MRVLVTGGAGFIGSHLVDVRAGQGHAVAVLDDLSRGKRDWIDPRADLHLADIRDTDAVQRVVDAVQPEAVAHLAALHFIPAVDDAPDLAHAVNVAGTENVLAALRAHAPRRLIFASTAAVYPDVAGPISEAMPPDPIDLYGRTKVEGEKLVTEFAQETGAEIVVARLFNVIGARETNPHLVPEVVSQLGGGATKLRLGNTEPRRDYTDAADVAVALAALLETAPAGSTFNVGSGHGVSVIDVIRLCEEILGRQISVEVDPARVREVDRQELVADATALREATGWSPARTLPQTLAALLGEA
jgi:UDP-glucose 4-epimerase